MFFTKEYFIDNISSHSGEITFKSILNSLSLYKEFSIAYYQNIILRHWIILAALLIIFSSFFFIKDVKNKRTIIISLSLTIGILAFFALFIFARGETNSDNQVFLYYYNSFWLNHHDFPVIIRLELLMILMFALSAILNLIENNKKIILTSVVVLILGIVINIFMGNYKQGRDDFITKTYLFKKDVYMLDKIMLSSYNEKNMTLFLSEYNENYPDIPVGHYVNYVDKIYGLTINNDNISWVDKEHALDNYYQNGGFFEEEELEKLKFSNLYDIKTLKYKEIKFYPVFYWHKTDDTN